MKTMRLLKSFEVKFHFSIERVKRISVSIPDWADDAHLRHPFEGNETSDMKPKVVYFKGSTRHEINIPECKKSVEVFCTPLRTKNVYNTNRVVIIDLYF